MAEPSSPVSHGMQTVIREATLHDGLELARLRWDFRPECHSDQDRQEFSIAFESWYRSAWASGNWTASVAESNGSLVGCMFLESVAKVPVPGGIERSWGYVTNAFVESAHRGRGIGAALLRQLLSLARARAQEFLIIWPSEQAVSLYARAGFRDVVAVHSGVDDHPPLELVLCRGGRRPRPQEGRVP